MVSVRKKRQSNRRLLSQLDDFDPDNIIGSAVCDRQGNATVNEGTVDPGFTVGNPDSTPTVIEILVNAETLEMFFNQKIDRETGKIVDAVKERIQNAIMTAIGILLLLKSNSLLGL